MTGVKSSDIIAIISNNRGQTTISLMRKGGCRFQDEIERVLGGRAAKGKAGRPKAQPEHGSGQLDLL